MFEYVCEQLRTRIKYLVIPIHVFKIDFKLGASFRNILCTMQSRKVPTDVEAERFDRHDWKYIDRGHRTKDEKTYFYLDDRRKCNCFAVAIVSRSRLVIKIETIDYSVRLGKIWENISSLVNRTDFIEHRASYTENLSQRISPGGSDKFGRGTTNVSW